jgi:hypothetical protein
MPSNHNNNTKEISSTDNILTKFVLTSKENDDITLIDRFSSMTSPLSTTTDILYTEVDYCLNEVGFIRIHIYFNMKLRWNLYSTKTVK